MPHNCGATAAVAVEDYFQVSAFDNIVPRSQWDGMQSRIERNVDVLLDLLSRHHTSGTFFVLGWVASRYPGVVKRIVDRGHEVASHGWWHQRVLTLSPEQFREEVRSSKHVLEDIGGVAVRGFRAPSFSIVPGTEWAFDVLLEEGYVYDSSLFPVKRSGYGSPDAPTVPYMIQRPSGYLVEFPMTTFRVGDLRVPAAGGGYLRHFPYAVIRHAFQELTRQSLPGMFYIHPWEIDDKQPRLDVPFLTRIRHYRGLEKVLPRMERLLSEFSFTSVRGHLDSAASGSALTAGAFRPSGRPPLRVVL